MGSTRESGAAVRQGSQGVSGIESYDPTSCVSVSPCSDDAASGATPKPLWLKGKSIDKRSPS